MSRDIYQCATAYVVAGVVALLTGYAMRAFHPVAIAAVADVAATVVVFLFSTAFRNSSFYDPYWSVAPIPIALFWTFTAADDAGTARQVVVLLLVSAWSVRLTYNWLRRWEGLQHEDWRYADFREKYGRMYWLVDLFGIHLFPSVMVLLGCLSLYPALSTGTNAFGALDILAIAVTTTAIVVETIADQQLWHFLRKTKTVGQTLSSGLWAYSRHPNYFGEILFWWGLFGFALAADASYWWTIIGPVSMMLMFLFISVPMIDQRSLSRRPGYAERMNKVSAIVPWLSKR